MTEQHLKTIAADDQVKAALIAALEKAVHALNVKARFKVGHTDSYEIAAECDAALRKAGAKD